MKTKNITDYRWTDVIVAEPAGVRKVCLNSDSSLQSNSQQKQLWVNYKNNKKTKKRKEIISLAQELVYQTK